MGSLWRTWTVRQLQAALDDQSPTLLDDLEHLLPALAGSSGKVFNPMDLYTGESLSKVVEAFLPSEVFASKSFRARCLERLPPDVLNALAATLGIATAGSTFETLSKTLLSKPWRGSFAEGWVEFFELPKHFIPEVGETRAPHRDFTPASVADPTEIAAPFKQLKDYQFNVFFEVKRRLSVPRARLVLQMPTGSGKTRTSMEFLCDFLNEAESAAPTIVWLAHSEELCEQAFQCFKDVWNHLGRRRLRSARAWGNYPIPAPVDRAMVVFGGFQKLYGAGRHGLGELRRSCELVVVDEAHKTIAPTYRATVEWLLGVNTRLVGLTATPGRATPEEAENLADFYFGTKVGISAPEGQSVIEMLRHRRVLSHPLYEPITTGLTVPLSTAARRHLERKFDLPAKLLVWLGQQRLRNLEIIKRLATECAAGRRVLLFACSVEHSRFLTSVMLYLGHSAAHLDGGTAKGRRAQLIEEFRSGDLQVLCNYGVLTTGFDAPNTDSVFITRPTASPVLYSQMLGRGLRGPAIGGTPTCRIIDVLDNIEGFGDQEMVYDQFETLWMPDDGIPAQDGPSESF